MKWLQIAAALACAAWATATPARAQSPVEHGKYLVLVAGCTDCHTPGHFFGKPDMAHEFSGSEVGFFVPDLGTFYGPNLTPDKETGLGRWTSAQMIHALTTGERPDGRILAPIMPWRAIAHFKAQDVADIVAYLRSLPPVSRKVPGPFGPTEQPTSFVFKILPPQ
jgi:mono/diheme cytochrome c family protein